MTTTPNIPHNTPPGGRTVRDIVEASPALVNEVWCRKILRQLLQSLDTQYTNGAPHRIIMPDTIVVQANGDAILLPDPDAIPDFQPEIGADLRALAAVMHFAITHEMPSAGPLLGRGLEGYSDSLLGAIDRCMTPNKSQRPQTVAELRDLLGMVSVGLLKPSSTTPATAAPPVAAAPAPARSLAVKPVKPVDLGPPASPRKWLWIGLAAVLLAGALYIVRQHGAEELVGAPVRTPPAAAPAAAPVAPPVEPATAPAPAPVPAPAAGTTPQDNANYISETAENAPAATTPVASANATYRLMVKPWGTIYVDGKRHGVSPPLKRLVLPAGRHTVMLENPGFPDRIVQLDSKRGAAGQIAHDFLAGQPAPAPDTTEPAN